jgi:transposase
MGTGKMSKSTIGVDVSKDHLDAHRWPDGEVLRVTNDARGHKALIRWIIGAEVVRVVLEPTSRYHRSLEAALGRAGVPFARLHPTRARRFAEAAGRLAKTDRVDAGMLARMGALLEPPAQAPRPQIQEELAELQRARAGLQKDRLAAANRARAAGIALLRRQGARAVRAADRAIAEIDAAISVLIAGDAALARKAAVLASIPGVSAITAAALLAELPEIGGLEPGAAASLAGLAPVTRESGRWRGQARIRGGRAALRRALYMPALTAARFNPDLKAIYDRLRARGKPGKLALTAVMRKLLLLANALIARNRLWSPERTA